MSIAGFNQILSSRVLMLMRVKGEINRKRNGIDKTHKTAAFPLFILPIIYNYHMQTRLSLLMITKNAQSLLQRSLESVQGLVDEIVVVDDYSKDKTEEIAMAHGAVVYKHLQNSFGGQRTFGLSKCKGLWVLMLDADEILTNEVSREIKSIVDNADKKYAGYRIYLQNHFLGKPIRFGGEYYSKLVLFRRGNAKIISDRIHEHVTVGDGRVGVLKNQILHYSYQSLPQMFHKFTDYARHDAVRKLQNGEKTSIGRMISYPVHMFWARYIKDCGFKDYRLRILLDLGFAYMEFLIYFFMFFELKKNKKSN